MVAVAVRGERGSQPVTRRVLQVMFGQWRSPFATSEDRNWFLT